MIAVIGLFVGFLIGGFTFALLAAAARPMPRPADYTKKHGGYQPTTSPDPVNPPRGRCADVPPERRSE